MEKEYYQLMLSEFISELEQIKYKNGDLCIGFEDSDSYTSKCIIKTTEHGDLIIKI